MHVAFVGTADWTSTAEVLDILGSLNAGPQGDIIVTGGFNVFDDRARRAALTEGFRLKTIVPRGIYPTRSPLPKETLFFVEGDGTPDSAAHARNYKIAEVSQQSHFFLTKTPPPETIHLALVCARRAVLSGQKKCFAHFPNRRSCPYCNRQNGAWNGVVVSCPDCMMIQFSNIPFEGTR